MYATMHTNIKTYMYIQYIRACIHTYILLYTYNSLLHRKSPSPLPTSIPPPSIADTFSSFFSDKISSLRVTLQSLLASQSSTADPPPPPIPQPLPPNLLFKFSILPLKLKSYCS